MKTLSPQMAKTPVAYEHPKTSLEISQANPPFQRLQDTSTDTKEIQ